MLYLLARTGSLDEFTQGLHARKNPGRCLIDEIRVDGKQVLILYRAQAGPASPGY